MAFVPSAESGLFGRRVHNADIAPISQCVPVQVRSRRSRRAVVVRAIAKEVTADELEDYVRACARPLLVDAFAPWCGPCRFLLPQLDLLAQKYGDAVDILKLNTEKFPDYASAMLVRGLPTLFFIKDGELMYRMEGALPMEELDKLVLHYFFNGPKPTPPEPPTV